MTRARRTVASVTPIKEVPTNVEDQIAAFFKAGGKIQVIPEGVQTEEDRTRRQSVENSARSKLGGKRGGAAKAGRGKLQTATEDSEL